MHPFFGLQPPARDHVTVTKAAAAGAFLESLAQLQRGIGAELHAYLVRTTPELCAPDELTENVLRAESTLLAALLSYTG